MAVDVTQLQIFRGEILKELNKYQGESVKIGVIKKAFSPSEGMPLSRFRSVLNFLKDREYIEWDKKDVIGNTDDMLRITDHGQEVIDGTKKDTSVIVIE